MNSNQLYNRAIVSLYDKNQVPFSKPTSREKYYLQLNSKTLIEILKMVRNSFERQLSPKQLLRDNVSVNSTRSVRQTTFDLRRRNFSKLELTWLNLLWQSYENSSHHYERTILKEYHRRALKQSSRISSQFWKAASQEDISKLVYLRSDKLGNLHELSKVSVQGIFKKEHSTDFWTKGPVQQRKRGYTDGKSPRASYESIVRKQAQADLRLLEEEYRIHLMKIYKISQMNNWSLKMSRDYYLQGLVDNLRNMKRLPFNYQYSLALDTYAKRYHAIKDNIFEK